MTKTVLTVDDSSSVRDVIEMTLSDAGFKVLTASDGVEGLKTLEANHVDLIISDVNMPNMDGLEFIEKVRERQENKHTPIMMLTTENGKDKLAIAKQHGARAWMVKPFKSKDILKTVGKLI